MSLHRIVLNFVLHEEITEVIYLQRGGEMRRLSHAEGKASFDEMVTNFPRCYPSVLAMILPQLFRSLKRKGTKEE